MADFRRFAAGRPRSTARPGRRPDRRHQTPAETPKVSAGAPSRTVLAADLAPSSIRRLISTRQKTAAFGESAPIGPN
jgi:hypothetical protein